MFTRFIWFTAFSVVLTSGCDVYRGPLEEALRQDIHDQGKSEAPPAPPPSSFGPSCGCEELHAVTYDDCVANIKNPHVFAEAECGSTAHDALVACLNKCDESVCAGLDGRGFYEFKSQNAHGNSQPVSCNEGLALCMGTAYVNNESIYCTWNGTYLLDGGAEPPPPLKPIEASCDGDYQPEVDSFPVSSKQGRVDILRIYESRSDHSAGYHPMGDVKVFIEANAETLVLSSYEPTRWSVGGPGEKSLRRIIVTGYHEQEVEAPEYVIVERHVGPDQWWESGGREQTGKDNLIHASAAALGTKPSNIGYCYRATGFWLR